MQSVQAVTTKSVDFPAGATITIGGTAGELDIEAWDQPRVEATLTRSEYADADERDEAKKKLEKIGLTVEKAGNDIAVELKTPHRHFLAPLASRQNQRDIGLPGDGSARRQAGGTP